MPTPNSKKLQVNFTNSEEKEAAITEDNGAVSLPSPDASSKLAGDVNNNGLIKHSSIKEGPEDEEDEDFGVLNKIDSDETDELSEIPVEFPKLQPRPWRRRSCELINSMTPCVRKAVSHLHQLEAQLDSLHKAKESENGKISRVSLSTPGIGVATSQGLDSRPVSEDSVALPQSSGSHRRKIRWLLSSASLSTPEEESPPEPQPRLESSSSGALLEVRGHSAGTTLSKSSTPKHSRDVRGLSGLPPEYAVIDEVLRLLGRLEADNKSTIQLQEHEKKRVETLQWKIDVHAYRRMHDLPLAVQREHEACAMDINELKWHCNYRGRMEERLKARVAQAEYKYSKLMQDVRKIKMHYPLVQEKLELEGDAMLSIKYKQDETDNELRQALKKLDETERKMAEANGKAATERSFIKHGVDVVRNNLTEVSDELAQLKMYYTSNVHTMNDIKKNLEENAQQTIMLDRKEETVREMEAVQSEKVNKLREKIAEQEEEHRKLVDENTQLKANKQVAQMSMETTNAKLDHQLKKLTRDVKDLIRQNKITKEDIDELDKKIRDCFTQKTVDEKTVQRCEQETEKVKRQFSFVEEELQKVKVLNNNLSTTLSNKTEEYTSIEENLRITAEALKKQLREESHAKTVLQARIASDSADLVKSKVEAKKKKDKAFQKAEDMDKLVAHLEGQVDKLEKIHNERKQTIDEIDKVLVKVTEQHQAMEAKNRGILSVMTPQHAELKKENMELAKKVDHMNWKTEMMEKKMTDMASSTLMMNKVIIQTEETIDLLQEEMQELTIQIDAGNSTGQDLQEALDSIKERYENSAVDHEAHMASREEVLASNRKGLTDALQENKKLAADYYDLQTVYLKEKEGLMRILENRVLDERSLKDHKELYHLQEKMHEALLYYYKLRGLLNRAEVSKYEVMSLKSGERVVELHKELLRVIQHISNFLHGNNAAHKTISDEAAKIAKTPPTMQAALTV